ncbi:hypothetical protein M011DRAFT_481376 [Sporormia fimetaria CBS 119925]|uniref:Uncharacterized protein n=1 Tax=Sporormia fimetaria CBS 119925 TaxID=1340428 RepID=A0A6A6UWU7_9PLEO|nr:hypothetical protein M011DRAFT_481376 [Sporormia fimetaria CBS 119925]
MELVARPSRISRSDSRYRHLPEDVTYPREALQSRQAESAEEKEELLRRKGGRAVMGRSHRMYHRRQADGTVIIPTGVLPPPVADDGNEDPEPPAIISSEPGVPLPSVPAVPPFPSEFGPPSVPAYPWPSGVPPVLPVDATSTDTVSSVLSTPTSELSISPTEDPTSSLSSILAISSTIIASGSSTVTGTSTSRSTASPSVKATSTQSSIEIRTETLSSTSEWTAATPPPGGVPLPGPGDAASGAAAQNPAAGDAGKDDAPLPTPQVVGSVIGSLAGAALLLFILLFLIRRHKRKGTLQLGGIDTADSEPMASSGQQMATHSSMVPASAAAFLKRFSVTSRSTAETSTTGERGFQRISGRKLPSAFSEGMTSEQFARGEGTLSGSSFYRDDSGFYGGPGVGPNKEYGTEAGGPSNYGTIGAKERFMPSPARTPVIHHPEDAPPWGSSRNGGSVLSPPHSPNPEFPPRQTLGRTHISLDGSRSSRFTENV